jgi:hypothetical protein
MSALREANEKGWSHGKQFVLTLSQGKSWFELSVARKNGATSDDAARFIVLARDITGRNRAEEQIRDQLEELLRWQEVTLGREGRLQETKREVNELCRRLGEPERYTRQETGEADASETGP